MSIKLVRLLVLAICVTGLLDWFGPGLLTYAQGPQDSNVGQITIEEIEATWHWRSDRTVTPTPTRTRVRPTATPTSPPPTPTGPTPTASHTPPPPPPTPRPAPAGPPLAARIELAGPLSAQPVWHAPQWLIPDSELVNGPTAIGFNTRAYVEAMPGYLKQHIDKVDGVERDGVEIIELVARRYSIHPRLLLALLEWKGGWLSQAEIPPLERDYAFGMQATWAKGLYKQLEWVANYLNAGFYAAPQRNYVQVNFQDGWQPRGPDGLNQGTYALVYFLARMGKKADWEYRQSPDGDFMQVYRQLFGDPWRRAYEPLIPPGLKTPTLKLPWAAGETWWYTGAPHGGWGAGSAWGAIDFAPGKDGDKSGCWDASEWWARASTPGLIAVSDYGEVMQDLDGDGHIQTGWLLIYNHIAAKDRVPQGKIVKMGDPLGHPSCEGGWSSGTHVHLARRYNGVWIASNGPQSFPFVVSGWEAGSMGVDYKGTLTRLGESPRIAVPWRVPGQNNVESDNTIGVAQR